MTRLRGVPRRSALKALSALGPATIGWLGHRRAASAAASMNAFELKTAIIGKIAEFVRWPAECGLRDVTRPFEFVILGETPLQPFFLRYYGDDNGRIAGHRVWVRRAPALVDVGHPHLLFVGPPVLTVADTHGFAHRGIAVNLYLSGDQVRFEISRRAFARHRLEASYRLLGLARLIEDQQARR
jgi:hypothetical protein